MKTFLFLTVCAIALFANINCGGKSCGDYKDQVSCAAYACVWTGTSPTVGSCTSAPGTANNPGAAY